MRFQRESDHSQSVHFPKVRELTLVEVVLETVKVVGSWIDN